MLIARIGCLATSKTPSIYRSHFSCSASLLLERKRILTDLRMKTGLVLPWKALICSYPTGKKKRMPRFQVSTFNIFQYLSMIGCVFMFFPNAFCARKFKLSHTAAVNPPMETSHSLDASFLNRHEVVVADAIYNQCNLAQSSENQSCCMPTCQYHGLWNMSTASPCRYDLTVEWQTENMYRRFLPVSHGKRGICKSSWHMSHAQAELAVNQPIDPNLGRKT